MNYKYFIVILFPLFLFAAEQEESKKEKSLIKDSASQALISVGARLGKGKFKIPAQIISKIPILTKEIKKLITKVDLPKVRRTKSISDIISKVVKKLRNEDQYSEDQEIERDIIILPSAKVLSDSLRKKGYSYFIEKTDIIKDLAGQEKHLFGVGIAVEEAISKFASNNSAMASAQILMSKDLILRTILQHNPGAYEELERITTKEYQDRRERVFPFHHCSDLFPYQFQKKSEDILSRDFMGSPTKYQEEKDVALGKALEGMSIEEIEELIDEIDICESYGPIDTSQYYEGRERAAAKALAGISKKEREELIRIIKLNSPMSSIDLKGEIASSSESPANNQETNSLPSLKDLTISDSIFKRTKSDTEEIIALSIKNQNNTSQIVTAQDIHDFCKDMSATLQTAAQVANLMGCSKSSKKIITAGLGIASIGAGVSKLAMGAATLNPVLTIIGGIGCLASLFQDDKSDESLEIILDAIAQSTHILSEKIGLLHEDMVIRFDILNDKLDEQHLNILRNFLAISHSQNNTQSLLKEIYSDLIESQDLLYQSLQNINLLIESNSNAIMHDLESLRIEEINEVVSGAQLAIKKSTLSDQEFTQHLNALFIKATVRAKEASLTGGNISPQDFYKTSQALAITDISKNIFHHPAFSNINLLNQYLNQQSIPLANPIIWLQCVDTFTSILANRLEYNKYYPVSEEDKRIDINMLEELYFEGAQITRFIGSFSQNNFINQITHGYQLAMQELIDAILDLINEFENKETIRLRDNYTKEILKEAETLALLSPIGFTRSYNIAKNHGEWALDPNVQKFINIHQMHDQFATFSTVVALYKEPNAFLNQLKKSFKDNYEKISTSLNTECKSNQKKLKANLFKDMAEIIDAQQDNSLFSIVYPLNKKRYSIPLIIPRNMMSILPSKYIQEELAGYGKIAYEYDLQNYSLIIYVYFCTNKEKILIGNIESDSRTYGVESSSYSPDEVIWFYWYGGFYSRNENYCNVKSVTLSAMMLGFCVPGYSSRFIPNEAYDGNMNSYFYSVTFTPIQNNFDEEVLELKAQNRRLFNHKVITEAQPSLSRIYKSLEKVDAQFKLLDAFLMILYSENYQNEEFLNLRNTTLEYTPTKDAILRYLNAYADPSSSLSKAKDYLPQVLVNTSNMVKAFVGVIQKLKLQPNLPGLVLQLDKLDQLIYQYKERAITKKPVEMSNQESELVQDLRAQLAESQKQIADLNKKMDLIISLLQNKQ